MSVREYVGARYVPLFANPLQWSAATAYEPLTIVLNEGNSYTSRQYVPVGIDISNQAFWALTGNYNAQIEQYRQEVTQLSDKLYEISVKPEWYGATGDGVADDTSYVQQAINTGNPVYLENEYLVENITLPSNCIIYGSGALISKTVNGNAINANNASNITIQGITFQDNASTYNTRGNGAFLFTGCSYINVYECKIVNKSDRTLVFYNCEYINVHNVFCDTEFGSAITFTNCSNSQLHDIFVTAIRNNNYHSLDFYATSNNVIENISAYNIYLYNGNSFQITAEQEAGAAYDNLNVHSVHAYNGLLCVKFDGVKNPFIYDSSTYNTQYGFSFTGLSTTEIDEIVIRNCTLIDVQAGQPQFTVLNGNKLIVENCYFKSKNTISINGNNIEHVVVSNCHFNGETTFYALAQTSKIYDVINCIIYSPTMSLPNTESGNIVGNIFYDMNTTIYITLFYTQNAIFMNNAFYGTLPSSFRFNVQTGKLFYSGNTQNFTEFKMSRDSTCENAYTYQSVKDARNA